MTSDHQRQRTLRKRPRQNFLRPENIDKTVDTYPYRKKEERYARRVSMDEIAKNDYNLNITRYVSTAKPEPQIDLGSVHDELTAIDKRIGQTAAEHNAFLKELGLPPV